jgi:hypothetical protein
LRKLAQEKYIGLATAHKAVREKLKFFSYKVTAVQELKHAYYEKRIQHLVKVHSDVPNALYILSLQRCNM